MNSVNYLAQKYRWEFVRRNPRYRKAYKNFKKQLPKLSERDRKYNLFVFSVSWGVSGLQDPTKSFSQVYKQTKKNLIFPSPVYFDNSVPIATGRAQGTFQISMRFSKGIIMEYIEQIVDGYIAEYKKAVKEEKIHAEKRRARFNNFDRYLKVFDLREQGWTVEKIAEAIYPHETNFNYANQKVKRGYDRCLQFIENKYLQIR